MEIDQEIINEMSEGTNQSVQQSTFVAAEKNPDQHAKVLSLAEKFGAKSDFVEQNYDVIAKQNERNEISQKVDVATPVLKNFISNPDYAAVSKDDLDVLKNIEDKHDQYSFANQAAASAAVGTASIMSGITKLPALGANIAIKNVNDWRELFGQQRLGYETYQNQYSSFWDEAVHNYATKAPTASESWLKESFENGNHAKAGEIFALQFIQNAPNTIGLLAAGISGVGIPALIGVGGIAAANKASELEAGGTDLGKATQVGVINGGIEAAFESLGTLAPLKQWEHAITKEFGKQSGKEFLFNFGKTLAHTMGVNFSEEAATSIAQDFTDYASGVNPDAMSGSITRAFEAGGLGAATGGLLVSPAGISAGIKKRSQIKQAEINQKIYESIGQGTIDSKLAERLPKTHADYLKQVVKDGPVENIYMNAEGFSQYFQSKNINPNDMANELGVADSFNTAIETGTDVQIPTEVMAQKLAKTEHYEGLKDHVKFGPDQLSAYDVKIQEAESKRAIEIENENARAGKTEEEISTAEESAKEVGKLVEQQLKDAGYTIKQAKAQAKLYEQFFSTQGLKSNQAPLELFNKYGLSIQNVNSPEASSSGYLEPSKDIDTTEYFQASKQSKKLGIKFSATKVNNKISVSPLDTVSATAEIVDSDAGKTAVVSALKIDNKYPGVSMDAIKSLEYAAARNGATSMSISANRLGIKISDKVIKQYSDAGFTPSVANGDAFFVKKLDAVTAYNQEQRGSITFGKNRQFNINLFKSKDESTFLHESAHFFLEVMKDVATEPGASEQIKTDFEATMNWLGVKPGESLTVDQHEQFARGFESYLYEGKAPSDALRKAFHAFRQWLIAVYQSATKLNVDVSPEMKAVFDRMLASDEQIDLALEEMGAKQLFDDPTKIGMNDAEALEYLNATAFARMDARDQLQAELMKDLIRRKDSAYKNRYDEIYKQQMDAAKEMPEFKAIEAIQGEFKLQKDVIDNQYAVFKGYLPNRSTTAVGFAPDFIASMFGFENGQAMLQAIAPLRRGIVDYVEGQTVTRIKTEFPELLESPELTEEAIKQAHTAKYKRLKRLEMEYLLKNDQKTVKNVAFYLIKRMPTDEAVKKQSREIISKIKVADLKPHLYRSAEKRYALEAAKQFKKGEFGLAFEAKRKEYLNFELYKTAADARDDVKKSIKNFKKLFRSDEKVSESRDVDLVNAARAILADYGITKSEKTADEYLASMKEYDPESYTVVNGLVQAATENKGPYQQISYEDFVDMSEAVMAIYDLAKSRKEIEIDGERRDVDQIMGELNTQIESITPKDQKQYEKTIDKWGMTKERLLGAKASLVRTEHWAKAMDVKDNGVFFRYIFRPISDAVTKYRIKKNEVIKNYESILRKYEKNLTPQAIIANELVSNGKPFMFKNKAELMMAILHSGNESNLRKLLIGREWGTVNPDGSVNRSAWDAFTKRMQDTGVLTKADYDLAQEIWNLLESIKPDAQRAHKQMFGYYFNEITADKIVTPFGEYAGGYIPAKTDMYSVEDSAIRKEKEEFENNNNSFQFPTTGRGFTKSRVESYAAPLSLDMNMLGSHIDGVMRFSYIEPRVKEVSKIVLNKSFRSVLGKLDTNIAKDMLVPWLQRSAQQKMVLPASDGLGRMTDSVARVLRKNVAMQIMFGGVTNTLQQFTGLVVAMSKVKPKYIRNGLWSYITDNKATIDSIMTKSDWMQSTQGSSIYDSHNAINEIILNPTTFEKMQTFSKNHTYFLQSAAQNIVNNVVWAGAYEQSIEQGMTERDAIKAADSAVRTTQGTNNAEDVSRFEQGTATELLFKQFVGYFNMLANLNASELIKIQREMGIKKGAGKAFYLYLTAFMIPAVLSDVIVKAMAGKFDEDDDDEYLDDMMMSFFGSQFKTITATVPYGGQLAVAAYNKYVTKSPADDRLSLSPVISVIESTITAPIDLYKQASEGNDIRKKTVKDVLQLMGVFTGLPTGPIGKPVGYLMDVKDNKAQPTGPIDFTRGLVTGRTGK